MERGGSLAIVDGRRRARDTAGPGDLAAASEAAAEATLAIEAPFARTFGRCGQQPVAEETSQQKEKRGPVPLPEASGGARAGTAILGGPTRLVAVASGGPSG